MMAPILLTLWQWRKAILYIVAALIVAWVGWRTYAYGQVKEELATVKAELSAERACEADSACAKRAATLALEAAQDAAIKAAGAIQGALAREEAAQREASEWRRRYRSAVESDPDCAAWAAGAVKCPL
jgi:biopolymer transport protein ExbB/TolQ